MMMSMMGGYGLFMLVLLTFWIVIIAVAIRELIRWLSTRVLTLSDKGAPSSSGLSALEILQYRYARGEIEHETFDRMRERLQTSERAQTRAQSWQGYTGK